MNRSSELRVAPVKRYRVPKYPSHADPDPTRVPYPLPYPWSSQAVAALASLGIAASCSRHPGAATAQAGSPHVGVVAAAQAGEGKKPVVENTFALTTSGLPHLPVFFGTGAPNYLDDDLAREAIERVFRDAGYRLRPRYQYDRDGVTFIADGYDLARHIGYVYASYESLDRDALGGAPSTDDIEMVDYLLESLAEEAQSENDGKLVEKIRAIQRLQDSAQREAAYRELVGRDRPNKLSLAEARKLSARNGHSGDYIAVVSNFDERFTVPPSSQELEGTLGQAWLIPDPAKRAAASKAVREEAAREVIDRLEQAVRDYIAWARSQGLQ